MKLPNQLRINKGDYPEETKAVIDRLASTINPNEEALFNLAQNRISLRDNIASVVKDITVSVNAAGVPTAFTSIALGSIVRSVIGSTIIFAASQNNPAVYPTAQPFITFTQNGQTFEVNQIAGLPANSSFVLRVVVWGA